jgi:hypothetical protein
MLLSFPFLLAAVLLAIISGPGIAYTDLLAVFPAYQISGW